MGDTASYLIVKRALQAVADQQSAWRPTDWIALAAVIISPLVSFLVVRYTYRTQMHQKWVTDVREQVSIFFHRIYLSSSRNDDDKQHAVLAKNKISVLLTKQTKEDLELLSELQNLLDTVHLGTDHKPIDKAFSKARKYLEKLINRNTSRV